MSSEPKLVSVPVLYRHRRQQGPLPSATYIAQTNQIPDQPTTNLHLQTGLATGLTVSLFSKPLALLLGLAFLGLHTAEKQLNMRLIPYETIQKYFKGIDLRGAVQDNAAMKVSFGVMFALSGFASF